jgi:hypothetical protein
VLPLPFTSTLVKYLLARLESTRVELLMGLNYNVRLLGLHANIRLGCRVAVARGLACNETDAIEQHAFKKCKQLFKYQHLLLFRDIRWSKL